MGSVWLGKGFHAMRIVKLPTACFRRTTQRVQQRDRRQQDQGVCRIVLMHFHCKQSWPQANAGRRPCAALLAPTLAPLVWGFYIHPILGAMLILLFLKKSSVNPLTILCAFGVPRLNYTCFFATETFQHYHYSLCRLMHVQIPSHLLVGI